VSTLTRALTRYPIYPLLLAAYAVLYVYAENLTEVVPVDLVAPLGRALIGAATVFAFAALLYRDWRRGALVAAVIVVGASVFGLVQPGLNAILGLGDRTLLVLWASLIAGAVIVAARIRDSLATLTMVANAFAIVLISLSLITIVPHEAARAARSSEAKPTTSVLTATRVPDRDIYLLVFDRYGSNWSIEHRFGITDNDLPDQLAKRGFQVVPGARANYRGTSMSLPTLLNMEMHDHLTATIGPVSNDRTPLRDKLRRTQVAMFLKQNGYRYYHMGTWWEPTRTNELADEVLNYGEDTELTGVLHQASVLRVVDSALGRVPPDGLKRHVAREQSLFQFRQLERLAVVPGRKFVFAHILLPHPPYRLAADGRPIFAAEASRRPEAELYREQLRFTNSRILATANALLAGPDETDPIVVIVGDEGPTLCPPTQDCPAGGTPEGLGIRLGVLTAMYLPGLPAGLLPPDHSLVNTFRVIFSEYFGADLPRLPDRSFVEPDEQHPHEFREVTDILPLPVG
jgi:hypothetical protein